MHPLGSAPRLRLLAEPLLKLQYDAQEHHMGYCINVTFNEFCIPANQVSSALKALRELPSGPWTWVDKNWKSNIKDMTSEELTLVLRAWRYESSELPNGDVQVSYFAGEKLGNCQILWEILCPFVNGSPEIYYTGEDGVSWVYRLGGPHIVHGSPTTTTSWSWE